MHKHYGNHNQHPSTTIPKLSYSQLKGSARECHLNPLHDAHPVALYKFLASEEAPQSKLPVFHILHPSAGAPCWGCTPRDQSLSSRVLTTNDSIAQLHGDWDEIEGRMGASHCDARDSHGIQEIEALISAPSVVELKGRYSPHDNLSLSIIPADKDLVLDEHQEDKALAIMDEAHVCLSDATGFSTNSERNSVTHRYIDMTFVDTGGEGLWKLVNTLLIH